MPRSENSHQEFEEHLGAILFREGEPHREEMRQILKVFLEIEGHCTIGDIAKKLSQQGLAIADKLIEDAMETLCRYGVARKREFEDREPLYEHLHPGSHHDHLVCIQCGRIMEFAHDEMEKLQSQVAKQRGFYPLYHKMELYGLCSECFGARRPVLPLSQASPGERLTVVGFAGGAGMVGRLSSMGLTVGSTMEILGNQGFGPVLVAVRGTRLAVGREMAQKIMVSPMTYEGEKDISNFEIREANHYRSGPEDVQRGRPRERPLSQLQQGQWGVIKRINGGGHFRHRLMEMGFTPGTQVYVEKYAPLKDPIEFVIKGYHVSLRRDEAARVIIEQ
jgi:Fur family ferric uptake transcriptional regulator